MIGQEQVNNAEVDAVQIEERRIIKAYEQRKTPANSKRYSFFSPANLLLLIEMQRITLAPPLLRTLAPNSCLLCYLLATVPFLCTHYLGTIRKR
jgi:hypothetical protein